MKLHNKIGCAILLGFTEARCIGTMHDGIKLKQGFCINYPNSIEGCFSFEILGQRVHLKGPACSGMFKNRLWLVV